MSQKTEVPYSKNHASFSVTTTKRISPERSRSVRSSSLVTKVKLSPVSPTNTYSQIEKTKLRKRYSEAGELKTPTKLKNVSKADDEVFYSARKASLSRSSLSFSTNDLNSLDQQISKEQKEIYSVEKDYAEVVLEDLKADDKFETILPSKEGILRKEASNKRVFQYVTRNFWTANYYFVYSKQKREKCVSKNQVGVIDLRVVSGIYLVRRHGKLSNHFVVESDQFGEMLMLKAKSNTEANHWIEVLNKRLFYLKYKPTLTRELSPENNIENLNNFVKTANGSAQTAYSALLDKFVELKPKLAEEFYYEPDVAKLLVRSKEYMETGKKEHPDPKPLLKLLCCDLFETNGRVDHILSHKNNRMRKFMSMISPDAVEAPSVLQEEVEMLEVDGDRFFDSVSRTQSSQASEGNISQLSETEKPFIYCVHIQIPGPPFYSFVAYFAPENPNFLSELKGQQSSSKKAKLYNNFFLGNNSQTDLRNDRFKLLPKIVDGPFIVKTATPCKPALLGKKLTQRYFKSHPSDAVEYLEVCVDVGSSVVAWKVTQLCVGYAKLVTVDLSLLVEGREEEELPEEIIGSVRIRHLNMKAAVPLE
eukprot:augustus_masked-scaffold_9-processed-gene-2.10-mRNA-1 protein AED:0.40 eAED:0.42 QI:0/-1/0/1/-1/1/1/0/589